MSGRLYLLTGDYRKYAESESTHDKGKFVNQG